MRLSLQRIDISSISPVGFSLFCKGLAVQKLQPRRGATTVEFAVVVPVFFIFVFGMVEIGRGMMVTHLLNNAARDGCRIGIIAGQTTANITAAVSDLLSSQDIDGETVTVQVNDANEDASTAASGDAIRVQVTVPVANITWLPGGRYLTGTLSGRYSLRRE
jgi:Flp pilus assembly protein TadG